MIFIPLITTIQNLSWSLSGDNDSIGRLGLTYESKVHVQKVSSTDILNKQNTNRMSLLKMKQYNTNVIKSKNVFIIHTWGIISQIHSDAQGKPPKYVNTESMCSEILNWNIHDYIRACMIIHYAEYSYILPLPQYTKYL